MARAVETVAADSVFLVELIRKRVHVCVIRHRLVEGGVENSHLRHTRQDLLYRVNTLQVGGVVQRSQVDTLDDLFLYFRSDQHRLVEFLAAMHYAVTYGVDFFQVFDATDLRINQLLQNQLDTYGMFRHRLLEFHLLAVRQFHLEERVRQSDFLDSALCHHFLALHLKELVFDTTASAVQY